MWLHESQICSINIWYAVPWYADFDRYVTCPIMPNGYSNSESQMCYSCYVCIRNNDYLMVLTQVHCINQHCCHTRAMPASWKMEDIRFTLYIRMNFYTCHSRRFQLRSHSVASGVRWWTSRGVPEKRDVGHSNTIRLWLIECTAGSHLSNCFPSAAPYRLKNILHIPWPVSI